MRLRHFALSTALVLCAARAQAYDFIDFLSPVSTEFAAWGTGVAAGAERIYMADEKGAALLIFDGSGKLLKTVSGGGLLSGPKGVAVGPDGLVYVADTKASRIQVFDAQGAFQRTIGSRGSEAGRLSAPQSVAVGPDGRVFVADTGNNRVQVFTGEGVFLFGFGTGGKEAGQFDEPTQVMVDPADNVYVLDLGNERVQKFDPQTKHVRDFTLHGQSFTVDEYGFLYMVDGKRGKVKEIGPDGMVIGGFGTAGKGRGQFSDPQGIATAPDGTLLIADTGNKQIQRVRLTSKLKTARLKPNLATKLLVSGPTRVVRVGAGVLAAGTDSLYAWVPKPGEVVVFDKNGKQVRTFASGGKGETAIESVGGLAFSEKNGLFVSDTGGDKVLGFSAAGEHRANFGETSGMFASKKKEGRLKAPAGLAVNDRAVYIADTGNVRVDQFSPDGTFVQGFGPLLGPHELRSPVGVAWDEEGFIYVLDRELKKVFKCEPSGGFIKVWGGPGRGVGQFEDPVSIAYDGRSYVYVLDRKLQRVSAFTREGEWVTDFFSGGTDERSLSEPASLAVLGSELVIADPARGRIQYFALHPRLAPPVAVSSRTVDGEVVLQWEAFADPWVKQYRVQRSTKPFGPFTDAGKSEKPAFKDAKAEAYETYYYRVAVQAHTGDLGPYSRPVEVFVPGAFNRAPIEISTVAIGNVFSANYKWYLNNALGKVVIVNNVNVPFQNVKVSFRLKDFMDFATEKVIERLEPKGTATVPLMATLNNKILDVSEDTPIQAEVTVTFHEKGAKQEASQALPLKVYSRNAITWEDPKRIANFITPKDPPVLDLTRDILRDAPAGPAGTEYLNENVVIAMRVWSALGAMGVKFLASPNNPFEKMSEDPAFPVDYTQFPRDTLRRKSGQCDDLVTLISSMLEGGTVRAAVLDYPGHMAMMFDTGSNDPEDIGLPEDKMVKFQDTYWVPLEATLVGSPFEEAADNALRAYKEMAAKGNAAILDPKEAWKTYEPATLPKPDQETLKADRTEYEKRFNDSAKQYVSTRYSALSARIKAQLAAATEDAEKLDLHMQAGIVAAQHGKFSEAEKAFGIILQSQPADPGALNNLGNVEFLQGKYEEALKNYLQASIQDSEDASVWMNLVRTSLKLGKKEEAGTYAKKAVALDKSQEAAVAVLMKE